MYIDKTMNNNLPFILAAMDIPCTEQMKQKFDKYYELLIEWNKVMNLTAITDYNEVLIKHFADSISLGKYMDLNNVESVIDIGTGAGFPGIPLKIVYPNIKLTLLDSLNKRIRFLDTVIDTLQLKDVQTLHGRAEDFAKKGFHREHYDLAVSRAVANLAVLSEYCIPYVKKEGYFIPYKSGTIQDEVDQAQNAIKTLGGTIEKIKKFTLAQSDIERSLVFIKKTNNTPGRYPRKAGTPTKEPL